MKVDIEALKTNMSSQSITIEEMAKQLGIDRSTFYRRLNKRGESFTILEAFMVAKILGLDEKSASRIFFAS